MPLPPPAASALGAAPHPSAAPEKPPAKTDAPVRLGDTKVFVFRVAAGDKSPTVRARAATEALVTALDDPNLEVRVVRQGDAAIIYAGPTPVAQLFQEDALAAGDSSLDVHASFVAAKVRRAITSERERKSIASNVFSFSLVVFFALIALYLMRKVGEVADRIRSWLEHLGDRSLSVRVQRIELVTPAMLKSTSLIALGLAKWLGQFGIFYTWLLLVLSLFEATRGYTQRLTGFVVTPFSQFAERMAIALPLLVVATIAGLAVFILVRFVGLFFAGAARQETALAWLPPDLAQPTSVLLRIALVVGSLVFAAPVVTGDPNGSLGRAGAVALIVIGLSGTPLFATGLVGAFVIYGRRLRVGEHIEFAGALGRIASINLLELRLETAERTELRLPHLLLLRSPLRGLGRMPRLSIELSVGAGSSPSSVVRVLEQAAGRVARDISIELLGADADGVAYRVSAVCDSLETRTVLVAALLEALSGAGIPLGRSRGTARSA